MQIESIFFQIDDSKTWINVEHVVTIKDLGVHTIKRFIVSLVNGERFILTTEQAEALIEKIARFKNITTTHQVNL